MQSQLSTTPIGLYVSIALGLANLVAVGIGLTIAYRQLVRAHDWNRRKASQDLLTQLASGEIRSLRGRLDAEFSVRVFDEAQTYATVLATLSDSKAKADFRFGAITVLNYFESMAIGIKNNVLEDDTCFDYAVETVAAYWRWAQPLVQEVRPVAEFAWVDVEVLCDRWATRHAARLRTHRESARIPGRRPT